MQQSRSRIETLRIANPAFQAAVAENFANPSHITVTIRAESAAIASLLAKGRLDDVQVAAANRFQHVWETARGTTLKAHDPSRIRTGLIYTSPLGARQMKASDELNRMRSLVGIHGFSILIMVCCRRCSLSEICATRREKSTVTDLLRIHLDMLARFWRMRT